MNSTYQQGFQEGYRQALADALEEQRRKTVAMLEKRDGRVGPAMNWWLHTLSSEQLYNLWMGFLDEQNH